jgi:DNA adenine methylase
MITSKPHSPLRYPGGKSKFTPFVANIIEQNSITGGHYLEPYAGGAGVAFNLLFNQLVSHIHINDIDPAIYLFWQAVVNDTDNLLKLLSDTPINMEQWFYWRDVMNSKILTSNTEIGFATLFMNRTNRSGILKAGVVGGKNQSGQYRLGDRFKKDAIAARIEKIALYREKISIYKKDALELLGECNTFLPKQSLVYLDPPYYVKGQGLYRNFYNHKDHLDIAKKLKSSKFNRSWIVSYDNAPEICAMYQGYESHDYQLNYTAQKRYLGQEVMFFSKSILLSK